MGWEGEAFSQPLSDWLAAQAGADGVHLEPPSLLPGGAVQQNWALDVTFYGGHLPGRHELVLRTNFQTPLLASRPKAVEFAVLCAVAEAGVTVPEPLWPCEDTAVIGQPFFVMRRLTGDSAARPLVANAKLDSFGSALAEQLARELALVHTLSPNDTRLVTLGKPAESSGLTQIAQWRQWLRDLASDSHVLLGVLDWLARHVPCQERVCLVHRDFRTGNFLVNEGKLTAILDWEFSGWGDPFEDIGWFCAACWRAGGDGLEAGGLASRDVFYRAYEAAGGGLVDVDAVAYWEVMAHVRWTIIARQQGVRAAHGDAPQHELLEAAARVPGLERDIATMIVAA